MIFCLLKTERQVRAYEGSQLSPRTWSEGVYFFDNNSLKHVYSLDCLFMYLLFFNRYVIVKIR